MSYGKWRLPKKNELIAIDSKDQKIFQIMDLRSGGCFWSDTRYAAINHGRSGSFVSVSKYQFAKMVMVRELSSIDSQLSQGAVSHYDSDLKIVSNDQTNLQWTWPQANIMCGWDEAKFISQIYRKLIMAELSQDQLPMIIGAFFELCARQDKLPSVFLQDISAHFTNLAQKDVSDQVQDSMVWGDGSVESGLILHNLLLDQLLSPQLKDEHIKTLILTVSEMAPEVLLNLIKLVEVRVLRMMSCGYLFSVAQTLCRMFHIFTLLTSCYVNLQDVCDAATGTWALHLRSIWNMLSEQEYQSLLEDASQYSNDELRLLLAKVISHDLLLSPFWLTSSTKQLDRKEVNFY